jgi:hypothetical protein
MNDVRGNGSDLIWNTIPGFAWKTEENHKKTSVRIKKN